MDKTVDSFLKEINEIAPPKSVWKECYDEHSGFTYYWNTQTDDVTWNVPEGFKKGSDHKMQSRKQLYIPPPSEEKLMLGSIPHVDKDTVKIYKIDEVRKTTYTPAKNNRKANEMKKSKYPRKRSSESEDEKIVLISSYGSESSDEEANEPQKKDINEIKPLETLNASTKVQNKISTNTDDRTPGNITSPSDSDDENHILTQIQTKAKMLKQLGGEVPESVERLVNDTTADNTKKEVTGFSLVAGYGDDSEEDSEPEEAPPPPRKLFPIVSEIREVASTLFPISKAVDVSQFLDTPANTKPEPPAGEDVDVKAFQRKRRIGVSLVNVPKRPMPAPPPDLLENKTPDVARPGFGFKGGTMSNKEYVGFKSAGVLFSKADEVAPSPPRDETDFTNNSDENLLKEIEEFHNTLDEKLKFLCEGHSPALPVQIMIIQMETLYTAMKEHCLKPTYLKNWLDNTCEDLGKLEEEGAPAGWLLLWDRTHKRYYYHNQTTGENQWQYPQQDIVSVDEAMDISTTPPPSVSNDDQEPVASMNLILPPPPPIIKERSMSPPPPPIISDYKLKEINEGQPYPPGVDEPDLPKPKKSPEPKESKRDSFTSELDSFYSDIATIECVQTTKPETQTNEATHKDNGQEEAVPVKKKKKVKMGQGLSMKKKGVSKLVEKWKNVQKNYN